VAAIKGCHKGRARGAKVRVGAVAAGPIEKFLPRPKAAYYCTPLAPYQISDLRADNILM